MESLTVDDGTEIWFATIGDRLQPAIMMGPHFFASFGRTDGDDVQAWIDGLAQDFFVIVADYPRGFGRTGSPLGMRFTPDLAADEYARIADAAGVGSFGWVGYSYGGAIGIQVACRTDRVSALVVGGFPPLNAPFRELVEVTTRLAEAAPPPEEGGPDPQLVWSATGFYTPLVDWAERDEVAKLRMPRMAFIGTRDDGAPAHGVDIPLADQVREAEPELLAMGWRVEWLDGEDHLSGVKSEVALPTVRDFLRASLLPT